MALLFIGDHARIPAWDAGVCLVEQTAHAARKLNSDEIVSFTAVHNVRSRAVMKRLKMLEMPGTFLHPSLPPEHPLAEHCLYKLSHSELQF